MVGVVCLLGCDSEDQPHLEPACLINSDCPLGERCSEGQCVIDDRDLSRPCEGEQCACVNHNDCQIGERCDEVSLLCVVMSCARDTHCSIGEVCVRGDCVTDVNADQDRDGIPDLEDNCPSQSNPDQSNLDGDSLGDLCDQDLDGDGVLNSLDNCERVVNPIQGDMDRDGFGNACDPEQAMIMIKGRLDLGLFQGLATQSLSLSINGEEMTRASISAEGSFSFGNVISEPEVITLRVESVHFSPFSDTFVIEDGRSEVDLGLIGLEPLIDQEFTGLARLNDQELSHEGILVESLVFGRVASRTMTDSEGHFSIRLPRADHTLRFYKPDYSEQRLTINCDCRSSDDISFSAEEVQLRPESPIELRRLVGVLRLTLNIQPDWLPEDERQVSLIIEGADISRSLPAPTGELIIQDLPQGNYRLRFFRPGFESIEIERRVSDEMIEEQNAEITMKAISLRESGISARGLSLTGSQLKEIPDLRGADLREMSLIGADLCGLDLSHASLIGADLSDSDLSGTELFEAHLDNASLVRTLLVGANLRSASLFAANLNEAKLYSGVPRCQSTERQTDLRDTDFSYASAMKAEFTAVDSQAPIEICQTEGSNTPNFEGIRLRQANLSEADLRGAYLRGVNLQQMIFNRADLRSACLVRAQLNNVDLSGAILDFANLSQSTVLLGNLNEVSAIGVELSGALIASSSMNQSNFDHSVSIDSVTVRNTMIEGSSWRESRHHRSRWFGVDFINVSLQGADLSHSTLPHSVWLNSDLRDTRFDESDLSRSRFTRSDLSDAHLEGVDLSDAELSGSLLNGAHLNRALLDHTLFELAIYDSETEWSPHFDYTRIGALGPYANFDGRTIPSMFDASGLDLRFMSFVGTQMIEVDFSGSDLEGSYFDRVSMDRSRFREARLRGVQFNRTSVQGVDFSYADLSEVLWSDLSLAETYQQVLHDPPLLSTPLDITLSGANLSNAQLSRLDLSQVDFSEVTLTGALLDRLFGCPLNLPSEHRCVKVTPFSLTELNSMTDLEGNPLIERLRQIDHESQTFFSVIGQGLLPVEEISHDFSESDLSEIDFRGLRFLGSMTSGLRACPQFLSEYMKCYEDLDGSFALFAAGVEIKNKHFTSVDLEDLDMSNSDLEGTTLSGSFINGLDLSGANLLDSDFVIERGGSRFYRISEFTICPKAGEFPGNRCGGRTLPICYDECPEIEWIPFQSTSIMKTEVTVEMYRACVDSGFCTAPNCTGAANESPDYCTYNSEDGSLPVNHLTWPQFSRFAEWVGASVIEQGLIDQLMASQRGKYPWGDDAISCQYADYVEGCLGEGPSPVCSFPQGNTSEGICDLFGNVREFVLQTANCPDRCPKNSGDPNFFERPPYRYQGVLYEGDNFIPTAIARDHPKLKGDIASVVLFGGSHHRFESDLGRCGFLPNEEQESLGGGRLVYP